MQTEYNFPEGELKIPKKPLALIILCLGVGDSRFCPRIQFITQHLQRRGFATFIFDVLSGKDNIFYYTEQSQCLVKTTQSLMKLPAVRNLPVGYFSSGYGTALAFSAAAMLQNKINTIVSCNGYTQPATDYLSLIYSPVLLIASQLNPQMVASCRQVLHQLPGSENLATIILGAYDLFHEDKEVQQVVTLAGNWFSKHMLAKPSLKSPKCMVA